MNILLFVMSMLMLLALMTYARLDNFRNMAFVQSQFKYYMESTERDYLNDKAIKRYQDNHATKLEKKQNEQEKNLANKTLSLNLLVNKEERDKHPDQLESVMAVARNLIFSLYADQPFFIEMEEKRPNFVTEIFAALMRETDQLPKSKKLCKKEGIATIDLKDPELNDVFTRMLKGAYEEPPKEAKEKRPLKLERGYYSLLDFISLGGEDKYELRVYLASKQFLLALFGSTQVVNDILAERYRLYRSVVDKSLTAEAASKEFESHFSGFRLPNVPAKMLNFGVSKTYPKKYD